MTGTIHHKLCPQCGNQTVDPIDGECKYPYCDEFGYNEDEQAYLESFGEDTVESNIFDGTPDWLRMEDIVDNSPEHPEIYPYCP